MNAEKGPIGARQRWRLPVVVLTGVFGTALAVATYLLLSRDQERWIDAQLEVAVSERVRAIDRSFIAEIEVLLAIRAFYEGSQEVTRDEFRTFTQDALDRHQNAIHALEWAPRIPAGERADHERTVQAEGERFHAYGITERADDIVVPAGSREEYFPVVYAEPEAKNRGVLGFDLGSEPLRYEALLGAWETGEPRASAGIQLVQDDAGDPLAMLFAVPVYSGDHATPEDRRANLSGFAVAVLRIDRIVEEALARFERPDVVLHVIDPAAPADRRLLYGQDPIDEEADPIPKPIPVPVAGRELMIHYRAAPRFIADRRNVAPWAVSLSLIAITLVGVAYLTLLMRRTARVEGLVEERTEEIRRVSRLQRAILNSASYSIISTDPAGVILTFNAAAERMLGYRAEEVVGLRTPELFHKMEEVDARARELTARLDRPVETGFTALVALAAEGRTDTNEWTYVRKDGTTFPVRLSVTALHDEEDRLAGFLGIADDITQARRSQREVEEAVRAAEAANVAKSRFLANMSHELRTPLNAIIGYSEMLEEDIGKDGEPQTVADLRRIRAAGHHLLRLINDVLDLSKVEAGRVELHVERVDLETLVQDVASTVRPMVDRNGNTLEITVHGETGAIDTDGTRLRQILVNLLSNAAKFTEKGTVRLETARQGDEVVFRVEDTGIGMTEAQLERVFEPFAQADESTTRRFGGTGLGLAIVRQYCELLGGRVEVRSVPGRGSTFTVLLPVGAPAGAPRVRPPAESDVILVIDDSPEVRDLVGRALAKEGYRVVSAGTGEEGLNRARELRPAAILLDVLLPGLDGWTVLAELKADPALASTPVLLQTMVRNERRGYALGAADYLVKPVSREQLTAAVERSCGRPGKLRILVVEDDEAARSRFRRDLQASGCQVDEAADGADALRRLAVEVPDLVVLDLLMPHVDGFAFLQELRRNPQWASIPVIILTAKDLTEEERRRVESQAQGVLGKGAYDRDTLVAEIRRLVRRRVPAPEKAQ